MIYLKVATVNELKQKHLHKIMELILTSKPLKSLFKKKVSLYQVVAVVAQAFYPSI